MLMQFRSCRIELTQGDITQVKADAIVNAANSHLAGGGGVDGAIHRAGGASIMQETKRLYPSGCPTGSAVATSAGDLNARYLFHAVGPVWQGGMQDEELLLCGAYQKCLELAVEHRCDSIAFPALSTGAYRYPIDLAAQATLKTICEFFVKQQQPKSVQIVLFDEGSYGAFSQVLETYIEK